MGKSLGFSCTWYEVPGNLCFRFLRDEFLTRYFLAQRVSTFMGAYLSPFKPI